MRKPAFIVLLALIAVGFAVGQEQGPIGAPPSAPPDSEQAQNQPDPPGRVARLNYIQGSVSLQPAGTQQWVDANPNRPLTTGDNLWADMNSRGEVHVGDTAIRLSAQTGFSILNLNDQAVQIEVPQGSLEMHVRDIADQEAYEVDTPNLAMTILRPGDYRVDVDPNGTSSTITLRSGSAEITAAGKAYSVNPGQQYVFTGTDQLTYDMHPAPPRDEFDSWSVSRDQLEDRSQSAKYVSRDVIGYEDLDRYGVWRQEPEYGPVWVPSGVPVGWAPYHYGHWVYVAPWGWTWVEDEPWGFAPFHYGRWALVGGGWVWVPGPVVAVGVRVRPVYAPALVGFVGGGGIGVSFAIGGVAGVGWFPLGPRDVWVPAYHCSPRYVENINITNTRVVNVTQVHNVYVNRVTVVNNYTYAHNTVAVTAVSRETFVNGAPVARSTVRVNEEVINHPQVIREARLEPTQRSAFGPAEHARALPPATLANRTVVTRMAPSPHAVAVGHTQPLVTERTAYRPSTPANGGQFNHPAPGGNPNVNAHPEGNRGFEQPPNNGAAPPPAGQNGNNATNGNRDNRTFQPPNRPGNATVNGAGASAGQPNNGARPGRVNGDFERRNQNTQGTSNPPAAGGNNPPPGNPNNNPNNNRGYRPFQPPSQTGGNANGNANVNVNRNPGNQPGPEAQPRPETQPQPTVRSNEVSRPATQPRPNVRPNEGTQPPAQPNRPVQEDRRAEGGGNPGGNTGGNAAAQPHENDSNNSRNEKQPKQDNRGHDDHSRDH